MKGAVPKWLRTVAGPNGLTLTGWLMLGVPAVLGGAAMLAGSLGESLPESLAWGVVAWIALGAVWWIARRTWMSGGSASRRQILILPTYLLAGAVRAAVIALNSPTADARTLIAVSILNITFLSIVLSVVVDRLRTLDLAAGRLEDIRAGLVDAGARAAQETARLRAYARETILAGVRQALTQGDDAVSVARGLRDVSDQVVRPMSHEIAESAAPPESPAFVRPQRDIASVARAMLEAGPIRPVVTTAVYCAFALPVAYYIHGWPTMLPVLGFTALYVVALLGLARLIPWHRLPTAGGMVLLAVILVATGASSIVVLRLGPATSGPFAGGVVYAAVFFTLGAGSIAVLRGLGYRQARIEESLVVAVRQLSEVVGVEQADLRRARRHLARVLHGVVQPRLVARALQVQQAEELLDVRALEAEIVALLADEIDRGDAVDVVRALHDIAEIWADSVDVRVDVPEMIVEALVSDTACALAVTDVTREAVNNAVLRGGARAVDVRVRFEGARVCILVSNDVAVAPPRLGPPGMGSEIYGELADSWAVATEGGRVEFRADFSLGPRAGTGISGREGHVRPESGVLADDFGQGT
jgi:hypothetical protein